MADLEAARLRLSLSDGEIGCPKKGTIALGRCFQLQGETAAEGAACTCAVFRAREGSLPKLEVIAEEPAALEETGHQVDVAIARLKERAKEPAPPKAPDRIAQLKQRVAARTKEPDTEPPASGIGWEAWRERKRLREAEEEAKRQAVPPRVRKRRAVERQLERLEDAGELRPGAAKQVLEQLEKKETEMAKEWLTGEEVAELMDVTPSAVRDWWRNGKLGKERSKAPGKGGPSLYPRAAVERLKAERAGGPSKRTAATPARTPPPTRAERPMPRPRIKSVEEVIETAARIKALREELAEREEELRALLGDAS